MDLSREDERVSTEFAVTALTDLIAIMTNHNQHQLPIVLCSVMLLYDMSVHNLHII